MVWGQNNQDQRAFERWGARVVAALDDHDPIQALVYAERFRNEGTDSAYCLSLCADAYQENGCFDLAERTLKRALASARDVRVRANLYATGRHLREKQRRYVDAAHWASRLAGVEPGHTRGWIFLGCALASQGRLDEAELAHRRATRLPGYPDEAYLNLGFIMRARGRFGEAVRFLRRAIEIDPKDDSAREALADVEAAIELEKEVAFDKLLPPSGRGHWHHRDRRQGKVRKMHDRRPERLPAAWEVASRFPFKQRALEAWQNGDLAQALVCVERGNAIGYLSVNSLFVAANLYIALCRFGEAEACLNRTTRLALGERSPIYRVWGKLREMQGRFGEAEAWLRKAVASPARSCILGVNLGNFLWRRGKFDEAFGHLERAARSEASDRAEALVPWGRALVARGRLLEAAQAFAEASEAGIEGADRALRDARGALALGPEEVIRA